MFQQKPLKTFQSNGVEIAYYEEGAGEPVLLVHGFASNAHVNWVYTGWFDVLTKAGFRVIALDNRGHGASEKLYDRNEYTLSHMAGDVANLIAHLGLTQVNVMGYSMGARITSYVCALHSSLVKKAVISGMGIRLIEGVGTGENIANALLAEKLEDVKDASGQLFRRFAEQTKSDLKSLASAVLGSRGALTPEQTKLLTMPIRVIVGTKDEIAGDGAPLAEMLPNAIYIPLEGKNHMNCVGDKQFKEEVVRFFS